MQQHDRAYRFIDDPAHKENLSGRVTAACLQCRRKKIKCSGEVGSCRQCREKSLVCEGPSSRKRPKREHEASARETTPYIDEQPATGSNSKEDRDQQQRPPGTLHEEDSGYGSYEKVPGSLPNQKRSPSEEAEHSSTAPTWSPTRVQHDNALGKSTSSDVTHPPVSSAPTIFTSPFAFNTSVSHYNSPTNVSSTTGSIEDWSYGSQGSRLMHPYHSNPTAASDSSYNTHTTRAAMSAGSMDRSRNSPTNWWSGASDHMQSSRDLISAAEVLEGQAQALRRQAARRHSDEGEDIRMRQLSQPSYSANMSSAGIHAAYFDSNSRPPDTFDMSDYFRPDGTMRSGLTPGVNEYPSWWDDNSEMQATQQLSRPYSMPTHVDLTPGPVPIEEVRQTQSQGGLQSLAMEGREKTDDRQETRQYHR